MSVVDPDFVLRVAAGAGGGSRGWPSGLEVSAHPWLCQRRLIAFCKLQSGSVKIFISNQIFSKRLKTFFNVRYTDSSV